MRVVLKLAETIAGLVCAPTSPPKEITDNPNYQKTVPLIKKLHSQAKFWHGTGRYQYQINGLSKYHAINHSEIADKLKSIISQGGLLPQYDPWLPIHGKYSHTISLSPYRIYARAYAEFHQNENEPLAYVYGQTKYWYFLLGTIQFFTGNVFKNLFWTLAAALNKQVQKKFQKWMWSVRKNFDHAPKGLFDFYSLRSDIPNNYGLLFGIRSTIKVEDFHKTIQRFEARSTNPIRLSDLTHVEVPLNHVAETKKIIENNGAKIPVIPIEYSEAYSSSIRLPKLIGINRKKIH